MTKGPNSESSLVEQEPLDGRGRADLDQWHQEELREPKEGGDFSVPLAPDNEGHDSREEDLKHLQHPGGTETLISQ